MPDALDQLRQLPDAPPDAPESLEQLGHRISRRRQRQRRNRALVSLAAVMIIGAVAFVALEDRETNAVHTIGEPQPQPQPTTTVTPTSLSPFVAGVLVSGADGIDLVSSNGNARRIYDQRTAVAYALGDIVVVQTDGDRANLGPPDSSEPIVVLDSQGVRELPVVPGELLDLLDVGVVHGKAVALVTSRTGTTPEDTNQQLYLVDLATGDRTDLGSTGGWEAGAHGARLLADHVVLLTASNTDNSVESRSLDGRVQWQHAVDPPDTNAAIAVADGEVLLLQPQFAADTFRPQLMVTRLDSASGSAAPATTLDLVPDAGLEIAAGYCDHADWDDEHLLCDQTPGGPLTIDLATGRTTPLGSFTTGVATAVRSRPPLQVFVQDEATWGGALVFLDDGSMQPDGAYDGWLAQMTPESPEVAARALLDVTVSGATTEISGNSATVVLLIDVQGDDSVSGIRYTVTLELANGRPAHFAAGTWGYRCARGDDTTSFLPRICV